MTTFVISSGHGLYVRGASGVLDEVNEARKVVDTLTQLINKSGHKAISFHDNTSRSQSQNLGTIVSFHNGKARDIDVSVHFNAGKGKGVEVLYYDAKELAAKVSLAISKASGLIDRGAKQRKELAFLRGTTKPAILIEVCFVDTASDAEIYRANFNKICEAIAQTLTGNKTIVSSTPNIPASKPVTPSMGGTYTVKVGDTLWGIAKAHNTTVEAIKKANNLTTDSIRVGDKLSLSAKVASSYVGKRVEAKTKVRYYNKPSWSDKDVAGTCDAGLGFTILDKVSVGGAEQYKVKNSKGVIFYITASEKFVTVK